MLTAPYIIQVVFDEDETNARLLTGGEMALAIAEYNTIRMPTRTPYDDLPLMISSLESYADYCDPTLYSIQPYPPIAYFRRQKAEYSTKPKYKRPRLAFNRHQR